MSLFLIKITVEFELEQQPVPLAKEKTRRKNELQPVERGKVPGKDSVFGQKHQ